MSRLILSALLLLGLTACARDSGPVAGFRDPAKPIYSSAVLDTTALRGTWRQVATFAQSPDGCSGGQVTFGAAHAGTVPLKADLCMDGERRRLEGNATIAAPGRLHPDGTEPWWILWADGDYRSLVIGTPSGRFGFLLERDISIPPDRLTAAREILEWNGYALNRLQLF